MRKIFPPVMILLLSFLSFIIPVSASSYGVPSAITSLTDSDYNTLINTISSNNISSYVVIYYYNSRTDVITNRRLWTNPTSVSCGSYGFQLFASNSDNYEISNDLLSLTYLSNSNFRDINPGVYPTYAYIVLSSTDFSYPELCSESYSLVYEDLTFTMPISNDLRFYTIHDIYESIYGDPYPLFTSFYDIVIEKLQLICEFFTSSYIYLSIFVIFIFYFCVLLLRRLI